MRILHNITRTSLRPNWRAAYETCIPLWDYCDIADPVRKGAWDELGTCFLMLSMRGE